MKKLHLLVLNGQGVGEIERWVNAGGVGEIETD
jgi:hypothetical protein